MLNKSLQDLLDKTLTETGLAADASQLDKLAAYLDLLVQWNSKMNLVGANNTAKALGLCLDSLYLAAFLSEHLGECEPQAWDLGAGAGLPGIPLRLFWQRGDYTMIESRQKRALFLQTCLARLALPATFVFAGRAEVFMAGKKADLILSRAFMPQAALLELVRPCLHTNGKLLLMRNQAWDNENNWQLAAQTSYAVNGKMHFLALLEPV